MRREKWVISDTHFFHKNVLRFKDRDDNVIRYMYQTIDEMHEDIIKKWNALVMPLDWVYHLGDVTFDYGKDFSNLMHRLNGRKRLVIGNHDNVKKKGFLDHFERAYTWKGYKDLDFTMSHFPLRLDGFRDGNFNAHGHTHNISLSDPHYLNMCVEVRNFEPTHFDTIIEEIKERKRQLK